MSYNPLHQVQNEWCFGIEKLTVLSEPMENIQPTLETSLLLVMKNMTQNHIFTGKSREIICTTELASIWKGGGAS